MSRGRLPGLGAGHLGLAAAGGTAAARQRTIGVVSPFLDGFYFSTVLNGIHAVARQRGYRTVVLRGTPADLRAPSLAADQVDAWIVVLGTDGLERLARVGVPLVTVSVHVPEAGCPSVLPDNRGGIRSAVLHLVEHGHRRIAFGGYFGEYDVRERFESYRATLAELGIPFDPGLVFRCDNNWYSGGHVIAEGLLARRGELTAAVFATDKNALGAMTSLLEAGVRIPEEMAVIGFDDIVEAQSFEPPLTTVRQSFEQLGRVACELAAARLAGEAVSPDVVLTSNTLCLRSSCGCDAVAGVVGKEDIAKEDIAPGEELGAAVARRMVELLLVPRPLPPGEPPAAVWPGVTRVIEGYIAALEGGARVPSAEIDRAYRQAVGLNSDLATLQATLRLLGRLRDGDRARRARLLEGASAIAAEARIDVFLERARLAISRARLEAERESTRQLGLLVKTNHDVGLTLLGGDQRAARSLAWLEMTSVVWSCLGLWEDPESRTRLVISGVYRRDGGPAPALGGRCPQEEFPPAELLPVSSPDDPLLVTLLPVRSFQRDWGVLAIVGPKFLEVAGDEGTAAMWATLLGVALERGALMDSLSARHVDLQQAYESERALSATVRELGCPVIPLLAGVLLVPLIGSIDGGRAQQVLEKVVEGVSLHAASVVLLDITGVPAVDAHVAHALGQVSRAAALLGARVALVGVRPELAMRLIGADLGNLSTYATLAAALARLAPAEASATRAKRGAMAP
ncbi:LacI family transcriptional regulator [Sorangium cellulosum]|uniref:LacI family transcriptional regulator n=1 Tax=Sorangium cellulosum TaxID=56 RepID=A0A2L0F1A2_SORCE|nr:LacI family transcriptional regulator [Sorangium cellulosum]